MRILNIVLPVLIFSSCVSKKVYHDALAHLGILENNYRAARKQLKTTERQLDAVRDSLKALTQLRRDLPESTPRQKPASTDTNSAAHITWMSAYDREVIYWLNVARLDPAGFFQRFLQKPLENDPSNSYLSSLREKMYAMDPVSALVPDRALYESALCHAQSSGKSGYVGHARVSAQCRKKYTGECCSYGAQSPLGVVMQLLIDEGVPGLGHRILCLLDGFRKIGVATAPHLRYGTTTVLDSDY